MIELRPYQSALLERVRQAYRDGWRFPLMVLPTGGGKTLLFSAIADGAAAKLKRVLIIAHRTELIDQIVSALGQFNVHPDIIAAGYPRADSHVIVASVQTLVRRFPLPWPIDLIIVDECHHAAGTNSWTRVFDEFPRAARLGVTATPIRLDGRGLADRFDTLVVGPSVAELTAAGFLSPLRIFAPPTVDTSGLRRRAGEFIAAEAAAAVDSPAIIGDAVSHYRQHCDGARALVFAVSVAHAEHIAGQFRSAGYPAVHLSGESAREIRRACVGDFQSGQLRVLVSCDLFSEGFDCPGAEAGIMLRPTASLGLYRQQVGRILRPSPIKAHAVLLDHVGNTARHGLPDEPTEWRLTEGIVKKRGISVKVCPKCWSAMPSTSKRCPNCSLAFGANGGGGREVEQRQGQLVELTAEEIQKRQARRVQGSLQTLADLKALEKQRGYKPGWAEHVFAGRQAKRQ